MADYELAKGQLVAALDVFDEQQCGCGVVGGHACWKPRSDVNGPEPTFIAIAVAVVRLDGSGRS